MKRNTLIYPAILLAFLTCYGQAPAADKVVVIPLTGKAKAAGTDGQFLINSSGRIAGTDVYYDKNSGNYGIGVRSIHDDAKLEVGGATWFWLDTKPIHTESIMITTPGGWPGFIAKTHGKRSDISFHDGFINLAGSSDESAPNISTGLTITNTARVGINTYNPASALHVQGEIRSTDNQGDNRLWGKGRPGISTVTDAGQCTSPNGRYTYSVSNTMVSWGSAAQACPAGTWVCTAAERGTTACEPNGVSETYINCAGDAHDATYIGPLGYYPQIPAWVADADNTGHLDGTVVRLNGGSDSAPGCEMRPVWCCSK